MTETRTIFLANDGRHVTLGRGSDRSLTTEQRDQIAAMGLRGFVMVMSGDYWGCGEIGMHRLESIRADDEDQDAAVSNFMLLRKRATAAAA